MNEIENENGTSRGGLSFINKQLSYQLIIFKTILYTSWKSVNSRLVNKFTFWKNIVMQF